MRHGWIPALSIGAVLALVAASASGNPLWLGYFELVDRPYDLSIPANDSVWHPVSATENSSNLSADIVQKEYRDNGDGVVSSGDWALGPIVQAGRPVVIVDVVSRLYRLSGTGWVLVPLAENGASPVGETWKVISPPEQWGTELHVDDWIVASGNSGDEPEDGDQVILNGIAYDLANVRLCTTAAFGVPVEPTTWGKIKQFMGGIF